MQIGFRRLALALALAALALALRCYGLSAPLLDYHSWRQADTASIAMMELVDNAVMWFVPGAMEAPLTSPLFWSALAFALGVALFAAWPVNRSLLSRGRGHALVHAHHDHH